MCVSGQRCRSDCGSGPATDHALCADQDAIAEDIQALHRLRERTVKERTALANQIRGLLAEYGIVIRLGLTAVRKALPEILEDGENGLTPRGRACFAQLRDELVEIDAQCARYEHDSHRIGYSRRRWLWAGSWLYAGRGADRAD